MSERSSQELETGAVLREQLDYYRERSAEYDQWWLRQGRYDRGPTQKAQWLAEASEVRAALVGFRPEGRILELACGTGIWTEQLLPFADELTAIDGSREMLAINAGRLGSPLVRYIEADLFRWRPAAEERFDTIFFGFWLSHVPPERFAEFWNLVDSCLAPRGRIFFVDSRYQETSTAVDHILPERTATVLQRRLNDGREFRVYKIFYDREDLTRRLAELGWGFEIEQTTNFFLYASGSRRTHQPTHG
ncbi:MAG: class I SAM-dependent methyltransferase [Gemmatimonadales bacterium]